MEKVRVFLTDWQVLFREGVHLTLCGEGDYEVIGETTDNEEAIDFIEKNKPGVAILNADHGELTGIEITRRIKQNLPSVAVILIMDNPDDDERLLSALKSGANACLSKAVEPGELLDTIKKVVQGEYPITEGVLNPTIASRITNEFEIFRQVDNKSNNLLVRLSPLEGQILQHIADSKVLEEIARNLNITEDTLRQRLYTILGKLVSNDRNYRLNNSNPPAIA